MRIIFLAPVFLLSALFLASCSKDTDNTETPQVVNPTKTTFKLDGVLITADETTATDYNNTTAGGRYLHISVKKDGNEILELHMPASTGTYPAQSTELNMTTSWLTYEVNGGVNFPEDFYQATSGSMNLTTCDLTANKLSGTFNFAANNTVSTKQITEGVLVVDSIIHN